MNIQFEWDAAKAAANLRKHGVSFELAMRVFSDDDDGEVIRIISARAATPKEIRDYEHENG